MSEPLSSNPALIDHLPGVFEFVLQKFLQNRVDDMLPAAVVSYNRTKNIARVQPLIASVTTTGIIIERAPIAAVPALRLGGGGAVLSFNLVKNDVGWIKANDRDISLFKQTFQQSVPNTKRKHSFSDALFIPDEMKNVVIAAEDAGNAVFQTADGTVRLALWPTHLKITAPNTAIGDTPGYTPNAGALLDLQSTNKALGIPSMSSTQKASIPSPRAGFVVYDTTEGGLSVYNGTVWS